MSGPGNDERALLEELAARARKDAGEGGAGEGGSPTPEELLDYLAGRLPAADEERVARQVVADADAASAAVDLADFQAAEEGARAVEGETPPADLATRAAWRELRGRLDDGAPRRRRWRPFLLAAAALLILLTAGLAHRVVTLQRQLDRPLTDVASVALLTGSRGAVQEITVAPGQRLLLTLEPRERCAAYEAVLAGPGAGERWSGTLTRDPRGRLTLLLAGEPGVYSLALSGCEPPRRLLEEHRFRVVRPAGSGSG